MNPFLEHPYHWTSFHNSFMVHAVETIAPQLGDNYFVKVEERLILHEVSAEERFVGVADVGITSGGRGTTAVVSARPDTAPVRLEFPAVDVEKQLYLEIRDRQGRQVVTVLELLSPSNKKGLDRVSYLKKRNQILSWRQTHWVEVDLTRGGDRPAPPDLPACDYYALVSRTEERDDVAVFPIGLRDPLPVLPVPLRAPDPDVCLDLKAVLDRTYDGGGFGRFIYTTTPDPPLDAADAEWAKVVSAY
jgi:hypothetical protein